MIEALANVLRFTLQFPRRKDDSQKPPRQGPTMSQFHQLLEHIQADGRISEEEALLIGEHLVADGTVDNDDVKLLVELYCHTATRSSTFDKLFFTTLEGVFVADGQI